MIGGNSRVDGRLDCFEGGLTGAMLESITLCDVLS